MSRPASYLVPTLLLAAAGLPGRAAAEASHHQASAGQVVSTATLSDAGAWASQRQPTWDLRLYPSALLATRSFDDSGRSVPLAGASRVSNHLLNAYVERYFGEAWGLSALLSAQHLSVDGSAGADAMSSLGDSFLTVRHTDAQRWGALSLLTTVKLPGTYPESAVTNVKQVDVEPKVLVAMTEILPRISAVVGAGYRLRLGGVKDELTVYGYLPVALARSVTLTPSLAGGAPIGVGEVAKNVVTAGGSAAWRFSGSAELSASYFRTVFGRNVVQADIFSLGIAYAP